jgi:hypothetical protein
MRRLALALIGLAVATGCAGDDGSEDALGDLLRYFPADTTALAVVSTNLESEQFRRLDAYVGRQFGQSAEDYLRETVEDQELSWEGDVKPLLGGELLYGTFGAPFLTDAGEQGLLIVFRSADRDRLRDVLEKLEFEPAGEEHGADLFEARSGGDRVAVEGDVLVFAGEGATLREALARADGDDGLTEARFDSALAELPKDALGRGYGDLGRVLDSRELRPFLELPWFSALRTAGLAVSFGEDRLVVDFALNTDPDGLDPADLPLATGREAPQVLRRQGQIAGGNRNQSFTTAFLFRLAELRFPDSRFVRDVRELERKLGIDFVAEVLRQFDGPSASVVSPDGDTFAARSSVRDPEALERLLPRLAPHLPRLVADLEALRSEGQALLFLFAPDALVLQARRVTVTREGDLWRVSGLTGEGPDQLYFGVLGDVFVVASDRTRARRVARERTARVEGARGAGVLRADLEGREQELQELLPIGLGPTGEIVAWLEASEERLRGRVTAELP